MDQLILFVLLGCAIFVAFVAGLSRLLRKPIRDASAWGKVGWAILVLVLAAVGTGLIAFASCVAMFSASGMH